jgi:MFS family permease
MSGARRTPPVSTVRRHAAATALTVTLALQMYTSLAATATSVLAPIIATDLGLSPNLIGIFVGILYAGSMVGSLAAGGFVERFGAIRVSQACVLLCAASLAAVCAGAAPPSPLVALLAIAPLALGLGYGPITPASSHLLIRTAPPSRMALTFSIKQTGVPAGAALAGALLPGLALAQGWRATYLAVVALGILIVVAAQPTRESLDVDRHPGRAISLSGVFAPLRIVIGTRALAELALTGFVYAATQVCLASFLVIYLTETLGFGIVAAGLALTGANVGGIAGRIVWGGTADRWVPPRVLLGLIGVGAAVCAYATAAFGPAWPAPLIYAICVVFGATAIGWNGVQLAEIARRSPAGHAGKVTGASGFITFAGVVLGPPTFALLAATTGSYRAGFLIFGSASLLCGARLLLRRPR